MAYFIQSFQKFFVLLFARIPSPHEESHVQIYLSRKIYIIIMIILCGLDIDDFSTTNLAYLYKYMRGNRISHYGVNITLVTW